MHDDSLGEIVAAATADDEVREILRRLDSPAASIAPKYFYDRLGSALFSAICETPEYYPTRTEAMILPVAAAAIRDRVGPGLTLVDLGAGDCRKADAIMPVLDCARYVAIDISIAFVRDAVAAIAPRHPGVVMTALGRDLARDWTLDDREAPGRRLLFYPGSPALAMTRARAQDRLRLFELHPADVEALQETFSGEAERVQVRKADGFDGLRGLLPPPSRRAVVLIDPPYEVKQDYRRVVDTLRDALKRFPGGTYAVWYPLLNRPEARQLPARLAELGAGSWLDVRLVVKRPARDGFGMFGSGMFVINPPWVLPERLETCLPQLVGLLGEDEDAGFDLEHHIE